MTNYENLKAAAQSLGDFCDNHEDYLVANWFRENGFAIKEWGS